jgi:hypothetical protein
MKNRIESNPIDQLESHVTCMATLIKQAIANTKILKWWEALLDLSETVTSSRAKAAALKALARVPSPPVHGNPKLFLQAFSQSTQYPWKLPR